MIATATRRSALAATFALALPLPMRAQPAAQEFSAAERALFMSRHFAGLEPPRTLNYRFTKSGSLEAGFSDQVRLKLAKQADGSCCAASAEFLSGERKLELPEVQAAEGNPVLLYFLERDIREMNRRTKGQASYFRKRIRMAVFQGARESELACGWQGKSVAARQFTIAPYADDPLRVRFESLADKRYQFILSEAVPGRIVALRSRLDAPGGATALLVEELVLEGATLPSLT